MSYVRIKKISGNPYAYLVENKNTDKGPRQRVKKYLGRIHVLEPHDLERKEVNESKKNKFVEQLVLRELIPRKFKLKKEKYSFGKMVFSPKKWSLNLGKKSIVLSINDGYLCDFTIKRILDFKKTKDLKKDAFTLARYFLQAGLPLSEQEFIEFYQSI